MYQLGSVDPLNGRRGKSSGRRMGAGGGHHGLHLNHHPSSFFLDLESIDESLRRAAEEDEEVKLRRRKSFIFWLLFAFFLTSLLCFLFSLLIWSSPWSPSSTKSKITKTKIKQIAPSSNTSSLSSSIKSDEATSTRRRVHKTKDRRRRRKKKRRRRMSTSVMGQLRLNNIPYDLHMNEGLRKGFISAWRHLFLPSSLPALLPLTSSTLITTIGRGDNFGLNGVRIGLEMNFSRPIWEVERKLALSLNDFLLKTQGKLGRFLIDIRTIKFSPNFIPSSSPDEIRDDEDDSDEEEEEERRWSNWSEWNEWTGTCHTQHRSLTGSVGVPRCDPRRVQSRGRKCLSARGEEVAPTFCALHGDIQRLEIRDCQCPKVDIPRTSTTTASVTSSSGGHQCLSDEYRCGNGQCLYPISLRCDGHFNCFDGTDEIGCDELGGGGGGVGGGHDGPNAHHHVADHAEVEHKSSAKDLQLWVKEIIPSSSSPSSATALPPPLSSSSSPSSVPSSFSSSASHS